jgi:hypothetical protein
VLPPALAAQVNAQGRLVMVRAAPGGVSQAVIGRHGAGGLSLVAAFDCTAVVLPPMRRVAEFVF